MNSKVCAVHCISMHRLQILMVKRWQHGKERIQDTRNGDSGVWYDGCYRYKHIRKWWTDKNAAICLKNTASSAGRTELSAVTIKHLCCDIEKQHRCFLVITDVWGHVQRHDAIPVAEEIRPFVPVLRQLFNCKEVPAQRSKRRSSRQKLRQNVSFHSALQNAAPTAGTSMPSLSEVTFPRL